MQAKPLELTSWGRNKTAAMQAFRPEREGLIARVIERAGGNGVIAYGDGRNYGDISLCDDGTACMTGRLDRFLSFDEETGVVGVEPGVTFAELFRFAAARGFLPPVSPGTAFATLGGGVASDVHGKNHDRHGSLGHHIDWLEIVLADGRQLRATHSEHPELFRATIGGCGLTGIISAIGLRLRRERANAVDVKEQRVRDLDQFFELMAAHRQTATYTVGWVDALQSGRHLGRGIFQSAEPVDAPDLATHERALSVPLMCPNFTLNRISVKAFNALYYRRVPAGGRRRTVAYRVFHHPLDSIAHWNRLYGPGGFYQFQCVLPDEGAPTGIRRILEEVSTARAASFLGVLKTFGEAGLGHLSFPRPGVTLSLDIPARPQALPLMQRLEALTLDYGGRIYLAKDATMSSAGFARMYPQLEAFRAVLAEYDPDGVFDSALARRLEIRGAAG